jgi:hypothetical protein
MMTGGIEVERGRGREGRGERRDAVEETEGKRNAKRD